MANRILRIVCVSSFAFGIATSAARGQTQFLMPDRNNDSIMRCHDANNDGVISDPAEVFLWFNAANAAGTLGPMNPTCQAVSVCRSVIMGDQVNRNVYRLHDISNDGDAQDAGESIVFADAANASLVSFAFPTGAAFDSQCRAYVVNAGNANGNDGIYRLVDLNGDGDAQDIVAAVPEIMPYVTDGPSGFGPGNGPYAPQEMFFAAGDVGYVRNSSANLHGIYRFVDITANGRADDAGEFTVFFDATNASGVPATAGFPLEPDRSSAQNSAMYTLQTAAGGVDQLVRVFDFNSDGDAQDAGEAAIVYENAAAGFTAIDIVSMNNGDVLLTDNSGITVIRLHDFTNDGDFMDAGESTVYLAGGIALAQARQLDRLCRVGDVNCDGTVNIDDLLGVINGWAQRGCQPTDVNCDGTVNIDDLLTVINAWG
jgi:hypothetical protein